MRRLTSLGAIACAAAIGLIPASASAKSASASACGYRGGTVPGYEGFGGSFEPTGWEIDAGTLDGIENALSRHLSETNARTTAAQAIVCVDAVRRGSNEKIDKANYSATFTLPLVFFARDFEASTHVLKFTLGLRGGPIYTLDGHRI